MFIAMGENFGIFIVTTNEKKLNLSSTQPHLIKTCMFVLICHISFKTSVISFKWPYERFIIFLKNIPDS